ncbi:MAG: type I methionyl aminopeptidase [Bdellovibrionaceae bacterium]|nr:type I methionyl aminopeptidase [Pseudobdellovibrionaceae bacterium]
MTLSQASDIKSMEKAGQLTAQLLLYLEPYVKSGVTTNELDQLAYDYTLSKGAIPAPLNYHGFPKSICTSVNDCICHGVPDDSALKEGDIVNIDVTCIVNGFFGDSSKTFFVGNVSESAKKITQCAYEAMNKGIEQVSGKSSTGDIGFAVNKYVTRNGYFVVKEIGGHGIGRKFHDDPFVPSFGKKGKGAQLKPWTCITVEPMINETATPIKEVSISNSEIKYYLTGDKTLSAQFEHTLLITDTGYEILTQI